ncbi:MULTISPECIES: VOC family protein [Streptomyces]|uniref:VOC family protein n=3 Tax=Streptomyces TaxID=1883 RepID=A0A927GNK9_STRGL|nr:MULTISPECIES: VOC family protein [Streptomyces]MBD2829082.1 VOC family protein [Streptomyces globisporus]MYW77545.1 VOC family protein [Streptomyces sp. SID8369]NEA11672.1 VOC family protein [Streptomyces sp. SID10692]ARF63767.1 VOC family protein [Streptomyces violaceoruber]KOG76274.1 3-demethylubiquinone-9 3-methyltransferase [Streptomyces griseus subsp. rhodochrous]
MQKITPCLWFDGQAQEAAEHYVAIFGGDSRILDTTYYSEAGPGETGSVLTVDFRLAGQDYMGLNGGPQFPFTEAISLSVDCADQAEVDRFWDALSEGGETGQCGWLKDRYGVSWQIVPNELPKLLADPDRAKADRTMKAMLGMTKLDIQALRDA